MARGQTVQLRPLIEIPPDPTDIWWGAKKIRSRFLEKIVGGTGITIEIYGICFWKRIRYLTEDGKELYRLEKYEDFKTRGEFFEGQEVRRYVNNRPCFVEYSELAEILGRIPTLAEVRTNLRLDKKTAETYEKMFKAMKSTEH